MIGSSTSEHPALFTSEQNKIAYSFDSIMEGRKLFSLNEAAMLDSSKQATKFGINVFRETYFFSF